MPFIRYRNEDCGRLLDCGCECGSGFPVMDLNIARVSDNFLLPGGRVVHGEYFTHLMYGSSGIDMFQFHQTSIDSVLLWIVQGPGNEHERSQSISRAVEGVKSLHPTIKVQVRITGAIPLSKAGKHRFVRSDLETRMEIATTV